MNILKSFMVFVSATLLTAGSYAYCSAGADPNGDDYISSVMLHWQTRSSAASNYSDYTNETLTTIRGGQTYPLRVQAHMAPSDSREYANIWIDYNLDGDFADQGEEIDLGSQSLSQGGTANFSLYFTVPSSAAAGTTRMRVTIQRNDPPMPCGTINYGEVEDYAINISQATTSSTTPSTAQTPTTTASTTPSQEQTPTSTMIAYPTTSTSSAPPTTEGPCQMIGNYPVCSKATLQEVVALIYKWQAGQATLQQVVPLIYAWNNGTAN